MMSGRLVAALRRARAHRHAAHAGAARFAARARPAVAVRDRRGALRQPVGPRLPRGLPARSSVLHERFPGVPRIALTATADALTRADIVERLAARRARASSSAASTGRTSATRSSRRTKRATQLLALPARRARGRRRHRLLPVAQEGRRDRRLAERRGHHRAAVPRRARRRRAPAPPGPLPARGRHRDGRDHRLRHGHRQARRALRRPPRPAEEHRGLLPGDRPRRPRRRCPPMPGWPTAWPTSSTSAA